MWSIDKNTMSVTMHKGDTGAFYVTLTRGSGLDYADGDVAIFEVALGEDILIHREYNLNPAEPNDIELGDGKFLVSFANSDTDTWAEGSYDTEIRSVINPKRNNKVNLAVTPADPSDPITATINEDTCLEYVETVSGTETLSYTTEWSENPASYGITVTGTPSNGDAITVSWNKNGDGRVVDGDNVRTVVKSTLTIQGVIIDI